MFPPLFPRTGRAPRLPGAAVAALALAVTACTGPGTYKAGPGPHKVLVADPVLVTDPDQSREIAFRVAAPDAPGPFPVVVFSHGARCYPEAYGAITDHWVSHGFVVILPNHLDSPNQPAPPDPGAPDRLVEARLRDTAFSLDNAALIAARAGLAGRADPGRLAVAGHSFGGLIAMVAAGLPLAGPGRGAVREPPPGLAAAVIMSGVGPLPELGVTADAFRSLRLPLMATGGTLDVGNTGGPEVRPWEWRMSPYLLAPAGDKYAVVLDQGDHYLGGLICRADRGGARDVDGARIDAALTVAFLDAYVKQDRAALHYLQTADVARLTRGRARFQRK